MFIFFYFCFSFIFCFLLFFVFFDITFFLYGYFIISCFRNFGSPFYIFVFADEFAVSLSSLPCLFFSITWLGDFLVLLFHLFFFFSQFFPFLFRSLSLSLYIYIYIDSKLISSDLIRHAIILCVNVLEENTKKYSGATIV